MVSFEIFDIIDEYSKYSINRPSRKVPKLPLWTLKALLALISVGSASHLIFGALFIVGAGDAYKYMTVIIAFILSAAFFYEADGRCWKQFATLCVICAVPRIFVWPVYTVAVQTSAVNGTDFLEIYKNEDIWGYQKNDDETLRSIWYVYYYNIILIFSTMQRFSLRMIVELKKQAVYVENLKMEEAKRNEIILAAGPEHI